MGPSEGIGGVTEPFQERMVMPEVADKEFTLQVLGHEQVHQFQYDIAKERMEYMPGWSSKAWPSSSRSARST